MIYEDSKQIPEAFAGNNTTPGSRPRKQTSHTWRATVTGEQFQSGDFWVARRASARPEKCARPRGFQQGSRARDLVTTVSALTPIGIQNAGSLGSVGAAATCPRCHHVRQLRDFQKNTNVAKTRGGILYD